MDSLVDFILGTKGVAVSQDSTWSLRWASAPPLWVVLLVIVPLVIGFVYVFYRRESGTASAVSRAAMASLRFIAVMLILSMLFNPVVAVEKHLSRKSFVLLLVDDSLSMEFKDRYFREEDKSRLALAAGLVEADRLLTPEESERLQNMSRMDLLKGVLSARRADFLDALQKSHRLKTCSFSSSLRQDVRHEDLKPTGRVTKIGDSVIEAVNELKGQIVAAVVLVSDGCENAGTTTAAEAARKVAALDIPIPIFTVGVGSPDEPRDIEVRNPQAAETILVGDEWEVGVTIRQHGYEHQPAALRLKLGDQEVEAKGIYFGESGAEQQEKIIHKPDKPGKYTFTVEVPVQKDETIIENNEVSVVLNVVDDKIRVLYVDTYPRWEYRRLKNALIRDRTMFVNCLLIEADHNFPQEKSPVADVEEMSVFPETRQELFKFDVIIFGDINPEMSQRIFRQPENQLKWIEEFVRLHGGGFVMICGENSAPRVFAGTPVESLLPVMLPTGDEALASRGPVEEAKMPALTPEGWTHPVMRLHSDPDLNRKLWVDPEFGLPGFYWHYPRLKEKPGATVLARHRDEPPGSAFDERDVIFAFQYYGAGKTFISAADSTWMWCYKYGDLRFYRFWRQVIKFVGQQHLLGEKKRFSLSVENSEYVVGDSARLTAKVLDENYRPARFKAEQPVVLNLPNGEKKTLALAPKAGAEGTFEDVVSLDQLGLHHAYIEETIPGEGLKRVAETTFTVKVPLREFENPVMNKADLDTASKLSGGSFHFLHDIGKIPPLIEKREQTMSGVESVHKLWDTWVVFGAVVAVLCAEWIYRKRRRLL